MRDVSLSLSGGIDAPSAKAFLQFIEFLDDEKPPMFVEKALTYVLRTEPPTFVTMEGLLDLVGAWAGERSAATGTPTSELFVSATRKIVDAHRSKAIRDCDMNVFYKPFVDGLASRCPEADREALRAGLEALGEQVLKRWGQAREAEFEETDVVEVNGRRLAPAVAADQLVGRIERASELNDEEFAHALDDLDRVLVTRVGTPMRTALERLVSAGAALLNAANIGRAARVFALADEIVRRYELAETDRQFVWSPAALDRLDITLLNRLAHDATRESLVGTIVRCVPDLQLRPVLYALEHERNRDRRRFVLRVLELRGAEALPAIVDRLGDERLLAGLSWYMARNLLYVLGRVEIAFEADRRRALDAAAPYLTSGHQQVRSVALALLKRLASQGLGPEAEVYARGALDPEAYRFSGDATRDGLFDHVSHIVDLLAASEHESSLDAVARLATEQQGAEFDLGHRLRDYAVEALGRRRRPLPRAAALTIVAHLTPIAERRVTFALGRFGLGVNVESVQGLVALVQDSPEPEVRELLARPSMRKFVSR